MDMEAIILEAIKRDPRSDYQLARDCDLPYSTLHRFATGERPGITIQVASKICKQVGLVLRPAARKKSKRKGR